MLLFSGKHWFGNEFHKLINHGKNDCLYSCVLHNIREGLNRGRGNRDNILKNNCLWTNYIYSLRINF